MSKENGEGKKRTKLKLDFSPLMQEFQKNINRMAEGAQQQFTAMMKPIWDLGKRIHYGRWPDIVEDDFWNMDWGEGIKFIWRQYAEILDNGRGIQAVQAIRRQLKHELKTVRQEVEEMPEDDKEEWRDRLTKNRFMLESRIMVIERLLTTYSVTGRADKFSDNQAQEIANAMRKKAEAGGRPPEYAIEDTKQWFDELSKQEEYQKGNGEPYITKIVQEIILRHEKKTGQKPSEDTIKAHRRKLRDSQNSR